VYANGRLFYRELIPSRGFQSCVDYRQVIGLGKITALDSLVIVWPDRTTVKINHPAINQLHQISQDDEKTMADPPSVVDSAGFLLERVKSNFDKHMEADNVDFNYELNLPKMLSREGPKAAVGDVNGDGLEDVYIGGTIGHPGQLYLQTPEGKFIKKEEPAFRQFGDFEDQAVLLFDADHDGDLDLFIGPGGNANPPMSRQMQNRLFKNDGKGNFTLDPEAFPGNLQGVNTAVAVAGDFNHDGFPDLFVGGRSVPREYGTAPASYLFINDGKGHFTDMAATKNPEIAHIGMVTAAAWADVAGDADQELIIVGEWMTPRIFSYKKDHFEEIRTNLSNLYGWWESLAVADLDGDGKNDLILGNIGENFYLRPDSASPVKLWLNDFDQNGITDKVLTRTINGKDVPVFLKHEMERQLPILKKQNLKNGDYAKKPVQELLPADLLQRSTIKLFNYPSSMIATNLGNGNFSVRPMPARLQLSSINAVLYADLNGDGYGDLVLGGNEFGFLPQFGRLDASLGNVMLNDGRGKFIWKSSDETGLELRGQIRDIVAVKGKNQTSILVLQNDEYPVLYAIRSSIKKPRHPASKR